MGSGSAVVANVADHPLQPPAALEPADAPTIRVWPAIRYECLPFLHCRDRLGRENPASANTYAFVQMDLSESDEITSGRSQCPTRRASRTAKAPPRRNLEPALRRSQ